MLRTVPGGLPLPYIPSFSQNGRNRTADLLAPHPLRGYPGAITRLRYVLVPVARVGVEPNLFGLKDR